MYHIILSKFLTFRIGVVLLLTSLGLFLLSPVTSASIILFEDDFENEEYTRSSWIVEAGDWKVLDGDYSSTVMYDGSDHWSLSKTGLSVWTDYEFHTDVKNTAGADKVILFRYKDWNNNYAVHMVGYPFSQNYVRLNKSENGVFKQLKVVPFLNTINSWYSLKVRVVGNKIEVYIDGTKYIDFDDTGSILNQGKIALYVWSGNYSGVGSITTSHFDNVLINDLSTFPSPTPLPVPLLKQTDLRWSDEIYDSATEWSSPAPPTIHRWGCAITSVAMNFLFQGVDKTPDGSEVNPNSINSWLQLEEDGYVNGGHVNWWALRRFTRLAHNLYGSPILDFRKNSSFNTKLLNAHLEKNQPDIIGVKQGGHFVVATGRSAASHFINDPRYPFTELSSYNSPNSIMNYFPTNTNLAALYLTVDPKVELFLTNQMGLKLGKDPSTMEIFVPGESNYGFVPPILDESNQPSGPGFQELAMPLPINASYSLVIWSDSLSPYKLTLIGYDRNGDPFMRTFEGIVDDGSPTLINFDYSQTDPVGVKNAVKVVTYETFRNDIRLAYSLGWINSQTTRDQLIHRVSLLEKKDTSNSDKPSQVIGDHLRDYISQLNKQNRINNRSSKLFLADLTQLGF